MFCVTFPLELERELEREHMYCSEWHGCCIDSRWSAVCLGRRFIHSLSDVLQTVQLISWSLCEFLFRFEAVLMLTASWHADSLPAYWMALLCFIFFLLGWHWTEAACSDDSLCPGWLCRMQCHCEPQGVCACVSVQQCNNNVMSVKGDPGLGVANKETLQLRKKGVFYTWIVFKHCCAIKGILWPWELAPGRGQSEHANKWFWFKWTAMQKKGSGLPVSFSVKINLCKIAHQVSCSWPSDVRDALSSHHLSAINRNLRFGPFSEVLL